MDLVTKNIVICSEIFSYLPPSDILNCSLVCKLWRTIAQTHIKKHFRRSLDVCVSKNSEFNISLLEMLETNTVYNCDVINLVEDNHSLEFHDMICEDLSSHDQTLLKAAGQRIKDQLPKLGSIRISTSQPSKIVESFLETIVELFQGKHLSLSVPATWLQSSAITLRFQNIKEFQFLGSKSTPECLNAMKSFSESCAGLEKMVFSSAGGPSGHVRYSSKIQECLARLIETSSNTLVSLTVSIFDISDLLETQEIPPMQKLTKLGLVCSGNMDMLRSIDLSFFPSLYHVYVLQSHDTFREIAANPKSAYFQVSKLSFGAWNFDFLDFTMGEIVIQASKRFPNVRELTMKSPKADNMFWNLLIQCCSKNLKKLEIIKLRDVRLNRVGRHLDSIFCGLSEHEFSILRKKSLEHLSKTSTVPNTFALYHIQKLRMIELEINHAVRRRNSGVQPGLHFLSSASGPCCFRKLSDLKITVIRTGTTGLAQYKWFDLRHLEPFVCIKTVDK